jgi:hypothetical protein
MFGAGVVLIPITIFMQAEKAQYGATSSIIMSPMLASLKKSKYLETIVAIFNDS